MGPQTLMATAQWFRAVRYTGTPASQDISSGTGDLGDLLNPLQHHLLLYVYFLTCNLEVSGQECRVWSVGLVIYF